MYLKTLDLELILLVFFFNSFFKIHLTLRDYFETFSKVKKNDVTFSEISLSLSFLFLFFHDDISCVFTIQPTTFKFQSIRFNGILINNTKVLLMSSLVSCDGHRGLY